MSVKPIPVGYHSVTPYLIVDGAENAIKFYETAFGASETMRLNGFEGKLMHAEIRIGDSMIMLADEMPEMGVRGPKTIGGAPVTICLYVEDADSIYKQAIEAGAKELRPLQDQFYGDRSGTVEDPFGHAWTIATHIEDLSVEEVQARMETMFQQGD